MSSQPSPSSKPRMVIKRRQKLAEIEGSLEHKLALQDWNAQLSASFNSLDRKLNSRNSFTSQLYQILGLFFIFQGLTLTAVVQASAVKCHNSWLILSLSYMVSAVTIFGCSEKLNEIAEANRSYLQEKALCSALFQSIQQLKAKGVAFDLENGQPDLQNTFTDQIEWGFSAWVHTVYKMWWSYKGAMLYFLLAFSAVTALAIRLIVCDPQRNT